MPNAEPGTLSQLIVSPTPEAVAEMPAILARRTGRVADVDWPIEAEVRGIVARRKGFDPDDQEAISMWNTAMQSLFFDRIVYYMRQFFTLVGVVTLALGGMGVMNIMLIAVRDRTREIGVRKALGATTRAIERQFFLEGFVLTMASGLAGLTVAGAFMPRGEHAGAAADPLLRDDRHLADRRAGPRRADRRRRRDRSSRPGRRAAAPPKRSATRSESPSCSAGRLPRSRP